MHESEIRFLEVTKFIHVQEKSSEMCRKHMVLNFALVVFIHVRFINVCICISGTPLNQFFRTHQNVVDPMVELMALEDKSYFFFQSTKRVISLLPKLHLCWSFQKEHGIEQYLVGYFRNVTIMKAMSTMKEPSAS